MVSKYILVQVGKQYKHRYEQGDLLFQVQDHLQQNQYYQISEVTEARRKNMNKVRPVNKKHLLNYKIRQTFPINVLNRRIPGVSTPAYYVYHSEDHRRKI